MRAIVERDLFRSASSFFFLLLSSSLTESCLEIKIGVGKAMFWGEEGREGEGEPWRGAPGEEMKKKEKKNKTKTTKKTNKQKSKKKKQEN